jgi:ABC-type sugar transport system ATPase subunit
MTLDELTVFYGSKAAVKDVSIAIRQGEVLALIGPSGCGKTTLLRTLNRLTELTPTARRDGTIALDGRDIDLLEVTELRRRVAMVFQQPNPFPMSIFDNVAYALREQASRRSSAPASTTRFAMTSTAPRCVCRAASSSGCASPAPSPRVPRCCSWTSRARPWTRARPRSSRSSSATCARSWRS